MKERLKAKLSHFNHWDWDIETRYIRTQHSLSWGYIRSDYKLIGWREWKEFKDKFKWKVDYKENEDDLYASVMPSEYDSVDDAIWRAIQLGRLTCQDPANFLEYQQELPLLQKFIHEYTAWKNENGYIDFIGMIEQAIERKVSPPSLTHIFVDEAQDMCPLLYEYHKVLYAKFPHAEINWYADEDQCVYKFMGADPKIFVNQPATETIYGEQSHRLPERVATYAHSIISKNKERLPKLVIGSEKPSEILKEYSILCAAQSLEALKPEGTVLWLTATNWQAKQAKAELELGGYPVRPDKETKSVLAFCQLIENLPFRLKRNELQILVDAHLDNRKLIPFTKAWFEHPHKFSERVTEILGSPDSDGISIDDPDLNLRLQAIFRSKDWRKLWENAKTPHEEEQNRKTIERLEGCLSAQKTQRAYEIELSTFHRAKGREATNTVVCLDLKGKMLKSVYDDVEAGRRLFFVAVTRTKQNIIFYRDDWKRGVDWEEATR